MISATPTPTAAKVARVKASRRAEPIAFDTRVAYPSVRRAQTRELAKWLVTALVTSVIMLVSWQFKQADDLAKCQRDADLHTGTCAHLERP